jgi:hypothetical protein
VGLPSCTDAQCKQSANHRREAAGAVISLREVHLRFHHTAETTPKQPSIDRWGIYASCKVPAFYQNHVFLHPLLSLHSERCLNHVILLPLHLR